MEDKSLSSRGPSGFTIKQKFDSLTQYWNLLKESDKIRDLVFEYRGGSSVLLGSVDVVVVVVRARKRKKKSSRLSCSACHFRMSVVARPSLGLTHHTVLQKRATTHTANENQFLAGQTHQTWWEIKHKICLAALVHYSRSGHNVEFNKSPHQSCQRKRSLSPHTNA